MHGFLFSFKSEYVALHYSICDVSSNTFMFSHTRGSLAITQLAT